MKRNLNYDNIDIFFLLNENKILTETELQRLLPKENYQEYIKGFYRRRFIDIFNKNYDFSWFVQRYLNNKREFKIWNFQFNNYYFLIKGIEFEEDLNKLIGLVGYVNHYVFTPEDLKLTIILEMETDREVYDDIYSVFKVSSIFFTPLKINEFAVQSPKESDNYILKILTEFYKVKLLDANNPLQEMFLFCNICNIQYSSSIEMAHKCGKGCLPDNRRKELLKNFKDFSFMKDIQIDFICKSNIIKFEENVYKCAYCEKKFESVEFINLHYQKRHSDEIALREKKYEDFKKFIDNLDLLIFYLAEGSLESKPWFAKLSDDNKVIYDMNHVFSGEIVFD